MHKKIIQWQIIVTQILSAIALVWTTKKRRKDTPILMAGNPFRNTTSSYALAALPSVSVPIQDVQLFDYALAHKTVNAGYGLTASSDDTYIIGKDLYTSDQQRSRDQYEIKDIDWNEVTFEQVLGSSKCKLALHNDWIANNNYAVDAIVNMNLPEQGISGPFQIISIKHITPQKKPVDEDESDEWEYRPVTGLFIHHSDQVHNISFDNNETIGVTAPHPIFSITHNDWRLAGELEVGEKVLTYHGEATVTKTEKKAGSEAVYNLEIKDLHNFLVGDLGVVVHNNYGLAEAIVNAIKAAIPAAYKKYGKCKEYAKAMRAQLIANGTAKPKCYLAKVVRPDGKRDNQVLYHNGQKLADNGIHIFTPINNKVFDNLNPDGLEVNLAEYTDQFETIVGYKIQFREILDGENILNINE